MSYRGNQKLMEWAIAKRRCPTCGVGKGESCIIVGTSMPMRSFVHELRIPYKRRQKRDRRQHARST